jgi:hypothetical protein
MQRSTHLIILTAVAATLSSCYGPEPRPFAGRGGRSLDQPPRYGDTNRYVEPTTPPPPHYQSSAPSVPQPSLDPSGAPTVDPGLSLNPTTPGGVATPTSPVTPPAPTPPPASANDVPFARAVPGSPGFVYSPKDPNKKINVQGLRGGQKARDPETGDIFRVPY